MKLTECTDDKPDNSNETDTLNAVGDRIECPYYGISDEGNVSSDKPWCTRFQIHPKCTGDVNRCDVLMFAPDPRDGFR